MPLAAPARTGDVVLEIADLQVSYGTPRGRLYAVDGVDLSLRAGETSGIVGESGCGKSSLGRGLMQLLPPGGQVEGSVRLAGDELVGAGNHVLRRVRGEDIALIFQEPMTRLDPLMRVSDHFVEAIRAHRPDVSKDEARELGRQALRKVGIPPTRIDDYPHQFSGGMRQRIMIALGIVLEPLVIVADEPTTALDVIVEAQILDLLDGLRREQALGLILITHNLGIVAETVRPRRGDVRGSHRRDRARWRRSSPTRGIPTPRGCCRRSSASTRPSSGRSTARRRTSSTRPGAAASRRGARRCSTTATRSTRPCAR